MIAYFVLVFLTGALTADLNNVAVVHFGPLKLTGTDVINDMALGCAVLVIMAGAAAQLSRAGRTYCCLLAWLLFEVAIGTTKYGMSAIGEFRYVAPLFWFFVPIAISGLRRVPNDVEGSTIVRQTLWVAAAAGLVMLLIELSAGGRVFFTQQNQAQFEGYTDFRGVRYLDTYQTFNITLAACLLFLGYGPEVRARGLRLGLAVALTLAALWTRNRAALVALVAGFVVLALLERRFRLVIRMATAGVVAIFALAVLSSSMMQNVTGAFAGVAAPTEDATGKWRLLLQAAALQQALEKPVIGHGYGGYYSFDVPGLGTVVAPPHNQYIELFMKGGIIAVLLAWAAMITYGRQFWRLRRDALLTSDEKVVMRLLLVLLIAQVPYGVVYDFPPLFGLLIGCGEVIWQRAQRRWLRSGEATAHSSSALIPAPVNA